VAPQRIRRLENRIHAPINNGNRTLHLVIKHIVNTSLCLSSSSSSCAPDSRLLRRSRSLSESSSPPPSFAFGVDFCVFLRLRFLETLMRGKLYAQQNRKPTIKRTNTLTNEREPSFGAQNAVLDVVERHQLIADAVLEQMKMLVAQLVCFFFFFFFFFVTTHATATYCENNTKCRSTNKDRSDRHRRESVERAASAHDRDSTRMQHVRRDSSYSPARVSITQHGQKKHTL
jgi:hypothetical protein